MNVAVETRVDTGWQRRVIRKAKAYVALTKPRIIELLLVTTAPVMILAANGIPNLWLFFATIIGGAMSAGSAGAFNCYIDRDIDRVMKRTSRRPLVTGELTDREALVFSWVHRYRLRALARPAGQPAGGRAVELRHRDLRRRLQPDPQAPHPAEHRLGRTGRLLPGPGRLGRRHRHAGLGAVHPVRGDLPLDPAALLAAVHAVPRGLRLGERSHARRRARPHPGRTPGGAVRLGDGRVLVAAHSRRLHGHRCTRSSPCSPAAGSSGTPTACTPWRSGTPRATRCGCSTPRSAT